MNINNDLNREHINLMSTILFVSSLFIFLFNSAVFKDIQFVVIFTFLFIIFGIMIMLLALMKENTEKFKEIVMQSFILLASVVETKTEGRGISEIEFNRYGASVRVFILDSKKDEVNNLLDFVMDFLKLKDESCYYQSMQMVKIDKKDEIPKVRKSLKKRIREEQMGMKE